MCEIQVDGITRIAGELPMAVEIWILSKPQLKSNGLCKQKNTMLSIVLKIKNLVSSI